MSPAAGDWQAPPIELSVAGRIKEYILINRLSPGDPMPTENELSARLGISRSRTREAMKTLSALDIVEVRHGYGTYVGRMSLAAMVESLAFRGMLDPSQDQHVLADLIDLRELIETSLADLLAKQVDTEQLAAMRELTSAMHAHAAAGEGFTAEDRAFHLLLMETTGNALAVQLTGAFWDVHAIASASLVGGTDLDATARAHTAMLDAIEDRDPDALRSAIVAHYEPIRARMRASRQVAATPDEDPTRA